MEDNNIVGLIPWPVAAATAIWFGVMAYKAGKNRALWAVGGGLLGLVITTIIVGLGQAVFLPFSTEQIAPFRLGMAVLAVVLVFGAGWLFTGTLHRHLLASLKRTEPPAPEVPVKTSATSPKP